MNLSALSIRHPVTLTMVLVSLMVLGAVSTAKIKLGYLPERDFPQMTVWVPYPNSSPDVTEREIARPLEAELSTLEGLKRVTSTSRPDGVEVKLEFGWNENLDRTSVDVNEKIDQCRPDLPDDIRKIWVFKFNTSDIPVVRARISSKGRDLSECYDLIQKRIVNRIQRIPGVARVDLGGVEAKQVMIDLELDKLKAHRVDLGALLRRLQGENINLSAGKVRETGRNVPLRVIGEIPDLETLRELTINARGLRLGDIADIDYRKPEIHYGRHLDGTYAVALEVLKDSTANTVEVASAAMDLIQGEIAEDPRLAGINLFAWEDQAEEIRNGIFGLLKTGAWGGFFAVGVIFFFLRRLRTTLIVSFAIPFSLVTACTFLFFLGKDLNLLVMTGLMLGVGMLVDNAVVMFESIFRHREKGLDGDEASLAGSREVSTAVVMATLTTVIVFLPLMVGADSELIIWLREVGVSISITIVCSLFVSLTLIPLAAARLLKKKARNPSPLILALQDRYVKVLAWTLGHRWITFFIVILLLSSIAIPFKQGLEMSMFGGNENKRLWLVCEITDTMSLEQVEEIVTKVEGEIEALRDAYDIESVYSYFTETQVFIGIGLERDDVNDGEAKTIRAAIRDQLPEIPGAKVFFWEDSDMGGAQTYFAIRLYGEDRDVLRSLTKIVEEKLLSLEELEDVRRAEESWREEVLVEMDRTQAKKLGITPYDLAEVLEMALGGRRLRQYRTAEGEVDMIVSLRKEDRKDIEDLKNLMIVGSGEGAGGAVPLGTLCDFNRAKKESDFKREDRRNVLSVRATFEGKQFGKMRERIASIMDGLDLQTGYTWSFDQRIVAKGKEKSQMIENYILAVVLIYIVMASLFESLLHPFAIIFSIPFAMVGVAWTLFATDTTFNLMAQVGLLILFGIVVNNGIVLIDHVKNIRKAGASRREAILVGGRERLRPIVMTAATTILGLTPMAFGKTSVFGGYYNPLARTVIGGLLASTALTLLVLPMLYTFLDDMAAWLRRLWRASETGR